MKPLWLVFRSVCLIASLGASGLFAQEILEVRRSASIYAEPAKDSGAVHEVTVGDGAITVLTLASAERQSGYYKVRIPGSLDEEGWIYKTYVRRLATAQKHPKYVAYNRSLYRHWVDENKDCRDTRVEVLLRDARAKVVFADERKCKVESGVWMDVYTGNKVTDPTEMDVDHLVPLKNAHDSGGWTWSKERRREYANSLAFRGHLLAVSASENRRKGEKGPERYMPPNQAHHCDYLRFWTKVKQDWELSMNDAERSTVSNGLEACRSQ